MKKQSDRGLIAATVLALCVQACGGSSHAPDDDAVAGARGMAGPGTAGVGGASAGSGGSGGNKSGGSGAAGREGVAQGGAAQGGTGGRDQAGVGGQNNTGGGSQVVQPACLKPNGTDVPAQDYALPTGCFVSSGFGAPSSTGSESRTITDEATFVEALQCQSGVASGIDFSTQRLQLLRYQAAGTATRTYTVETSDEIEIGLSSAAWCGGAAPPLYFSLVLLPAGPKPVVPIQCTSNCNFGAGGFPP